MPAGTGCLVTDSHFFYSKQVAFLVQLEGDGDHLLEELQETQLLLSIKALGSDLRQHVEPPRSSPSTSYHFDSPPSSAAAPSEAQDPTPAGHDG